MTADDETTAVDRLVAALGDPSYRFTPDQVVFLMAESARWAREAIEGEPSPLTYAAGVADGYWQRVAEENAAYPPEPYRLTTTARQDAVAVYRKRSGVDVVEPRPGDFPGRGSTTSTPDRFR